MKLANKKKQKSQKWNILFFALFLLFVLIFFLFVNKNQNLVQTSSFNQLIAYTEKSLFRPLKKNQSEQLKVTANNSLTVMVNLKTGQEKIFLEQNADVSSPIASITKLMTAIVALENYDLDKKMVTGTDAINAIAAKGGNTKALKNATTKDLLYILLIESNNTVADTLANQMKGKKFVDLMNQKAQTLGLKNTIFYNPSGLDESGSITNQSSANDLKKIVIYIMKQYPLIPQICAISEIDYYINNVFYKKLENTNILLKENSNYLWGKTGYTEEANGCIILVLKKPSLELSENQDQYLINIIMGAQTREDRFIEARKLENWITNSFIW